MNPDQAIPAAVLRKLSSYVYLYINPLDGKVFYVGKGKGHRVLEHLSAEGDSETASVIRGAGKEPGIEILAHGLTDEQTAFRV